MHIPAMTTYDEARARFRWQLPATFNFGADVVDEWAKDPRRLALLWCDATGAERRLTFDDVKRASNQLANALAARGVTKGDRVIVMLPRIPQWQIAMTGVLKLGAIPVPCIEMLTAKDVAYRATHSGAAAFVTTAQNTSKFDFASDCKARLSVGAAPGWLDFDAALASAADTFVPVRLAAEDPAIIYYTSGSTGQPKGVTHCARALFSWRVSSVYWQALARSDRIWCTADTGWSKAGTSIYFAPWSCGAAVLFYDGPFEPQRRLELIEKHRVTVFCAAATEFRQLVNLDLRRFDLSALRLTISAGETVNPEIVRRWQTLSRIPLLDGYGQTETLMTVLNYPNMPLRPGSMGKPLPGTCAEVFQADGSRAADGETGELVIELPNPQMMLGYWQEPERTQAGKLRVAGRDYWRTGDLVHRDADGYLYYDGRADDIISSAGYRIGPMEVENALIEHPAVLESAAVASPDPERGEVVKAFVVLRDGIAACPSLVSELQEHVKRVTAPYKYPRRIEFVAALPKNAAGKLLRRALRDQEYAAARSG